jgi:hypothetical protein
MLNPIHDQIKAQCRQLLTSGDFDGARQKYRAMINAGTSDPDVHVAYAALLRESGNPKGAQRHLLSHYKMNPVGKAPKSARAQIPRLLYARGFEETFPMIARRSNGTYAPWLRGGHFTLRYLMRGGKIPRQRVTFTPNLKLPANVLPPHSLILNTISDTDVESGSLIALNYFLKAHPNEKVINAPKWVALTSRDHNYERLSGLAGIHFPKTRRLTLREASAEELIALIGQQAITSPFIIRRTGTHTGRTVALIQADEDLRRYVSTPLTGDYYLIDYIPVLWKDQFFRKMRLFVIDGVPHPVVCHFDEYWNVHGGNRLDMMKTDEALMDEEKRFLSDWQSYVGAKAVAGIQRAIEATPLEFFGIDFTVMDSGDILIYELNASMRHSYDHARNFPYKLPYDQAITAAFQQMIVKYQDLARAERKAAN